jgi:hypothetical protein
MSDSEGPNVEHIKHINEHIVGNHETEKIKLVEHDNNLLINVHIQGNHDTLNLVIIDYVNVNKPITDIMKTTIVGNHDTAIVNLIVVEIVGGHSEHHGHHYDH